MTNKGPGFFAGAFVESVASIEGLVMSAKERERLLACAEGTLDTEEQTQKLVHHYTKTTRNPDDDRIRI